MPHHPPPRRKKHSSAHHTCNSPLSNPTPHLQGYIYPWRFPNAPYVICPLVEETFGTMAVPSAAEPSVESTASNDTSRAVPLEAVAQYQKMLKEEEKGMRVMCAPG